MASSGGAAAAAGPGASSAASTAHLANSALNLVALRDYYRAELASLLNLPASGPGPGSRKALVLDKSLSGPLGLVAEVDLLRANGVDQIHHLRDLELQTPCLHILYLVSGHRTAVALLLCSLDACISAVMRSCSACL